MRASTSPAPGETGMEDERTAIRGILVSLAVLVALEVALLATVTILSIATGIAALEESLVWVEVQVMPRPFGHH